SIGDFNGIKNIGNIELTNDTAITQVSQIQLNDTIVGALVDSYQAANTTTHLERLTIRAIDNFNVANATVGVSIDAGALTAQSSLDVTLGRGANFLSLGAGADRVVLLGNYVAGTYNVTENGVALNTEATATGVARIVTDTINLGAGNDTLVTYGALNLAGATLSGIENITANSAVVITASQYAALVAARAALSLTGPVLTFSGAGPHQLTIIDDVAGANNIDLSLISVTGGALVYDVTSSSNATGGGVNNITTSNAVTLSGSGTASSGTIGTSPTNGTGNGAAANAIAVTAGGVFNGTPGTNDNFTANVAGLVGTTVNGNGGDTDTITLSGGGTVNIGGGNTITNIKTLATDNTATNIGFTVTTSGISTINTGSGDDTVNLNNSGSSMLAGNVNLGGGNNTLTMEGKAYTGSFVAGSGSDTLNLVNGSNISAANVSGFEIVNIASNASVTMTAAQFGGFVTINAPATETVTFTTVANFSGNANVENYVLANGSNTFTAASGLGLLIGGTGNDTFNASSAIVTAATSIIGNAGNDTLNVDAITAALNMSTKVLGVETVNVTGGTNAAWTVTNENGAGVTLNFTKSAATPISNITLGSGGQTLNILGTGTGSTTITGGSGVDTINLSTTAAGADVITTGSNINAIDTVNNFKAAGADSFGTGIQATSLVNLTIANADTSNLAAAIATAATAASASLANTGQAYTVVVNSGTAAGTYAFQNSGGSTGSVDASDFLIKLGGTTGSIVVGDFGIPNTVSVTAGGTFTGVPGANDLFTSSIPGLNGTTINGNAGDTDSLTLTTAGTVNLNNGNTGGIIGNVKILNLANGTNTITYNTSAGFTTINGGTGDDTFIPNTALLPIVVNAGLGSDTIVLTAAYAATASGSGTFAANVTGFEKLRLTSVTNQTVDLQTLGNYSDVTFSGANGLTLSNLPSNGNITLNGSGTAFTISNAAFAGGVNDIVNLTLTDASTSAIAFATTGITASGVETFNITTVDGQATPTGFFNDTLTILGNSVKSINVSGNAGLTMPASSTSLINVDASGITLGGFTWTANALTGTATVKGSATGTNTVNMNSATAGVNYTGGSGNDNVTINATVSSTASLGNGNNSLALNGVTILGTYTAGNTGTDSLAFFSAIPDLSNATITGFENLTVVNNANITATIAQMSQFTGTVNASGTETLNLTTSGTFNAISTIEKYNLANGTNNFTSANVAVSVIGGTGTDVFNFTANQIVNFLTTVDGGNGIDILSIGATTTQNIDLSTKVANIEIVNVAGSTGTASLTNVDGAGVTLNYTKSTGDNTITLGSGGQTLNLLGSSVASTTVTGGAAVDTINLQFSGSGSETLIETGANMSNKNQVDIVGNFNSTGTDYFKTGVNAATLGVDVITTATTANYLTVIAGDLAALLNNSGQAYLITIQGGSAAGTYLFQNTGSDTSQFDSTDFFVQLTGTVGTISIGNLIA
ncbi:beta strand repeat-containing protein, partial [Undibacterium sp. Ji50W]|uniref:beta strand repeat-containing protein n=1 Tax=Undibacterium sp. Ji50W TaxID=3413041 RepID=UPI003BF2424F